MRPTASIHEVFIMRFQDVNGRYQSGRISTDEAAELLGISVKTFYRKRKIFDENGLEGLVDGRIGKLSNRRIPVDEAMRIISLYKTKYYDFTVKHFHEKLADHGIRFSYTYVKNTLQQAGLVKKAKKRGQHRRKRPRKSLQGMMLHQDGSSHEWIQGQTWDLIVTMDDATSEIYSMFFCEQEGTQSSFQGFYETFVRHGLPCSVYVDRGSHYFFTPKAGGKVDKNSPTQVGRAMQQLGVKMIESYCPQGRGRSERMFGTLQKRLPQELRINNITNMEEANHFLKTKFLSECNKKFSCLAEEAGSAFVAVDKSIIKNALCIQNERTVKNDNTIQYFGREFQLLSGHRQHYVRCKVHVHEYFDGKIEIFYGPRKLEIEEVLYEDNSFCFMDYPKLHEELDDIHAINTVNY